MRSSNSSRADPRSKEARASASVLASASSGLAGSSFNVSRRPRSNVRRRRISSTHATAPHGLPRRMSFHPPTADRTSASSKSCCSGGPRFASAAALTSASDMRPPTTRRLAEIFGLVPANGCHLIESSSSESSTTSAESADDKTTIALEPNSARTSSFGTTTAASSITTSRSTSDNSCHVPAATDPNTTTDRTRSSRA